MNDIVPSLKISPSHNRSSFRINNLNSIKIPKSPDGSNSSRLNSSTSRSRKPSSTVSQNIRVAHLLVNVESDKAQKLKEIKQREKRYKDGFFTKFMFIYSNNVKKENYIDKIINSYFELQNEITKFTSLRYFYAVEYEDGITVNPEKFRTMSVYRVREIIDNNLRKLKFYPQVPIKWEFTDYYAAPKDWVDQYALKKQLLQKIKEEEEKRKRDNIDLDSIIESLDDYSLN